MSLTLDIEPQPTISYDSPPSAIPSSMEIQETTYHLTKEMSLIVEITSPPEASRKISAHLGETLLEALRREALPVLSVCGGKAACGTCKINVDPNDWERLPAAETKESGLLAHLPNVGEFSRLSCQVKLTEAMDGLRISLILAPKPIPRPAPTAHGQQ